MNNTTNRVRRGPDNKLDPELERREQFTLRLPMSDAEQLRKYAAAHGLTIQDYLVLCVLNALT